MSQIIPIPDALNNRGHDQVWFDYQRNNDKLISVQKAVCYYQCMSFLPECDFTLQPTDAKSLLPFDVFRKYINLCQANGLVNKDATVSGEEGKNQLIVPKGQNKHRVYTTLCCYRWSENQPGMAFALVGALEKFPEIDFYQAFHYGCARRVYWPLHSFHTIIMAKSTYNNGLGENGLLYVPHSLALAHTYRNGIIDKFCSTGYTANAIEAEMGKLKFPECRTEGAKKYRLKEIDHILSPKMTKLYKETPAPELVEATMADL